MGLPRIWPLLSLNIEVLYGKLINIFLTKLYDHSVNKLVWNDFNGDIKRFEKQLIYLNLIIKHKTS